MDQQNQAAPTTILVVDDEVMVQEAILLLLDAHGYRVMTASNGLEALQAVEQKTPQLVLTDIRMPQMDGIELAGQLHERYPELPVLIMTAYAEVETAVGALKRGAFDFIIKPVNPDHLLHALAKAEVVLAGRILERTYRQSLEREVARQTEELQNLNREIIHRLTVVAEYRDTDTASHISRIGGFAAILGHALGLAEDFVERLQLAGALHDIGKVAIPDSVLLKPGPLTAQEFEIIKTHTRLGAKILTGSSHGIIRLAESIALHHHERWDGSGYPQGLRGPSIPIEGRILMLADQYDALRARRPYKEAFSHDKTCRILLEGDGRTHPDHFDPAVLCAFTQKSDEFARIAALSSKNET